ncbi:MAG: MBL fold metallo-hydrolase [Pedosphaera sp.]|nr:MBL fold metallo-hydrolase [Pedosphaera sp.]
MTLQKQNNNDVALTFNAPAGQNYRIDASANLHDWLAMTTGLGKGQEQLTDAAAPQFDFRFYRIQPVTGPAVLTGDHLQTDDGDVIFHPVNHASFVMQWRQLIIYNDPVRGATPYRDLPKADLILISHSHGDHFDSATLTAVKGPNARIIAPAAVYSSLSTALKAITIPLANGGTTNLMDLTIDAIPAYNSNHPKGTGNGYVLTVGGRRIYMAGDTGDIAEMRALKGIDVAFLCINVPYTMTVTSAASATREFKPRVVYPYHFLNADNTLSDLNAFKKSVATEPGIEVRQRKWY